MKQSGAYQLLEPFSGLPWWCSLILGDAVYVFLKFFVPASNVVTIALQNGAFFFALPFFIFSSISLYNRFYRRRLLDMQSGLQSIRNMSWVDFRLLVGEALRRDGFAIEERNYLDSEPGIDLIMQKDGHTILVQCKRWESEEIDAFQLQELYQTILSEKADAGLFVTTGTFTPQARAFAQGKMLVLADGALLLELVKTVQQDQDFEFARYLRRASLETSF